MGEVLEHVENPTSILKDLWRAAKPGAKFFMTTVIFTANIDHIYLFNNAEEIRVLVTGSGWKIVEELVLPIYSYDSSDMDKRPMNYGAILVRSDNQ
jgi:2-polyprenyl-3-methyl-5-hydroxy-6-metoxy-1,4-benzoquinol methylase